ncbi:MAG: hypothetical protein LBH93_05835 [Chitinispirillales bacterium]|jgi:hypothetical protein|nr:hypothetical protein [Chitinispirillales bacterium]
MKQEYAAEFFPKKLAKVERMRDEALNRALSSDHIASLLSIRFNREPLYKSAEDFYTPEYAKALAAGAAPAELSEIQRYRNPSPKEVNLLYSDIHSKEELYVYSASNAAE